ncbi:roadblock/LC7 domain-containing protein [Actinoplanes sp. NPDC051494]|uniref:roadblock/LC7 domain-containing protein n=1 Tax=Actinoplanes sp. NPDC051494 TaxID=3363907 RepID=UPI0037BADCC1
MQSTTTDQQYNAVRAELAALRHQVTGVTGCVIAGVDGLLLLHDTMSTTEPHDLAALAAGAHGISRTCGSALDQGGFHECTIHNEKGYLVVYSVGDLALLAVLGDNRLNVARLHLEARLITSRLSALLALQTVQQAHPFDNR